MKALVSLSGGLDSLTLLASVLENKVYEEVNVATFKYPSKHNENERKAATRICEYYRIPSSRRFEFNLNSMFHNFRSALLINNMTPIPQGHYEDESMKETVVPCRNMIFLSVLSGLCESKGIKDLYIGIHAGDHFIYPDCRPEFFNSMRLAVSQATEYRVDLKAPFLFSKKKDILHQGLHTLQKIPPYELSWTCYDPKHDEDGYGIVSSHCGKCGACCERLESFKLCEVHDPVEYALESK